MEGAKNRRNKKTSAKFIEVTESDKQNVLRARLAALEEDDGIKADKGAGSDDEFQLDESDKELTLGEQRKKKRKKDTSKRKARGLNVDGKNVKPLLVIIEEAQLDRRKGPNYLSAAMGPPTNSAVRYWCSNCGFPANYTCTDCASRYCSRKCYFVHKETRCANLAH